MLLSRTAANTHLTMWRRILIRGAERLGLTASARKRTFLIRGSCEVVPANTQDCSCLVVIPIPQQTPTQSIDGAIEWSGCSPEIFVEKTFGNSFAVWRMSARVSEKVTCEYRVRVHIAPTSGFSDSTPAEPQEHMRSIDPRIQKIAYQLSSDSPSPLTYAHRAYKYVLTHVAYGDPIEGLYTLDNVFSLPRVDCGGFSVFLIALLRAREIPARLVSGFLGPSYGKNSMHAWVEACISEKRWIPLDVSMDYLFRKGRDRRRSGRFGFVGSDHIVYSRGSDMPIAVDGHTYTVPLLQHPFLLSSPACVVLSSHTEISAI